MSDLSLDQRAASLKAIGRLSSLCFNYDYFASTLERVHEFYEVSKHTPNSNIMLFYGETGVGKTTIIEQFAKQTLDDQTPALDVERPILYLQVPASCTPKALAIELLEAFGDPLADKGTMPNMTRRVIKYLNELKVSLVILDEFQHLIETKNEKVLYATADWLKSVTNEVSSSFFLCGLPTVEDVISANPQLKRRVMSRFVLQPMSIETEGDLRRLQTILGLFSRELAFDNASVIASEPFAKAIHTASDGAIGRMVNIIQLTCLNALREDVSKLEKRHFKEALRELAAADTQGTEFAMPAAFNIL